MKSTGRVKTALIILLLGTIYGGISQSLSAQTNDRFPRSTPEMEGVSSQGIIDFLNAVDTGSVELHSFMIIRHGKVVAEGWWKPYAPQYKHIMFSASKTFTATAIGLAVSEGKVQLSDRVISFFPYSLPEEVSDYMKQVTIKHLLTMSVGQDPTLMGAADDEDWIKVFINHAPVYEPGTIFKYNNLATFMLSAIIQQVTGQTVLEYLKPRIFEPLNIRGIDWDCNPQGINIGAAGLRLRTEDMATFGQLLLQQGKWNGRQLIPAAWVAEATSAKIASNDPGNKRPREFNDWEQGYCYQMWRGRNNTVRLDGAGGQFVILIPDKDAVIVMTAGARISQHVLDLMHDYLIPAMKDDGSIRPEPQLYRTLAEKEAQLTLNPPFTVLGDSDFERKISGREIVLSGNNFGIESLYFTFRDGVCNLAVKRKNTVEVLRAGLDKWELASVKLGYLLSTPRFSSIMDIDANYAVPQSEMKMAARYSWTSERTLEITVRVVEESIGTRTLICNFYDFFGNTTVSVNQKAGGLSMPGEGEQAGSLSGTLLEIR
jgi:CubicO group peptidase (beta-lactamase class C family)